MESRPETLERAKSLVARVQETAKKHDLKLSEAMAKLGIEKSIYYRNRKKLTLNGAAEKRRKPYKTRVIKGPEFEAAQQAGAPIAVILCSTLNLKNVLEGLR